MCRANHKQIRACAARTGLLPFAVAFFLSWCLTSVPATAGTWQQTTVFTTTGWEYKSVAVETAPDQAHVVLVNPDGGSRHVSRSNIRLILDESGKDITRSVLGPVTASGGTVPTGQRTKYVRSTSVRRGRATNRNINAGHQPIYQPRTSAFYGPRYRVALSIGGGYSSVSGQWFEGLTGGPALDLEGRIAITNTVYLGISHKRQALTVDDIFPIRVDYITITGMEMSLKETYVLTGVMTESVNFSRPFFYGSLGIGGVAHNSAVTLMSGGEETVVYVDETKLGMLVAGGVTIPFGRNVGLNLELNMRITGQFDTNKYDGDTGSTGILIGGGIGLVTLLGR